jgi:ribulose-phosphate 3-epimerase
MHVSISILNANLSALGELTQYIESAGADSIQIDVMDGHFVPNIALGPQVCAAVREHTTLPIEAHLMVEHPIQFVEAFAESGATTIIGHIEALGDPSGFIRAVQGVGKEPGLAISPQTPYQAVAPYVRQVSLVIVMGVQPGAGGQTFMPQTLDTLTGLRRARRTGETQLQLDGGVNSHTIIPIAHAGADAVIGGSFVFSHPMGMREAIIDLKLLGRIGPP